jgi:hypothetical protein
MNRKQKNNLLGFGLIALCVIGGTLGIIRQNQIKNNHLISTALVYDYTIGGRGNAGGVWIDAVLEVNGKEYKSSSHYSTTDITTEGLKQLIDKSFPAVYNPSYPSNSHLMLLPKDFKMWGYSFPDSLNWLLAYIKRN